MTLRDDNLRLMTLWDDTFHVMTNKFDDRFAERHHGVSSGTVITECHPVGSSPSVSSASPSSAPWSSLLQTPQRHYPNAIVALISELSAGKNHEKGGLSHFFGVNFIFDSEKICCGLFNLFLS